MRALYTDLARTAGDGTARRVSSFLDDPGWRQVSEAVRRKRPPVRRSQDRPARSGTPVRPSSATARERDRAAPSSSPGSSSSTRRLRSPRSSSTRARTTRASQATWLEHEQAKLPCEERFRQGGRLPPDRRGDEPVPDAAAPPRPGGRPRARCLGGGRLTRGPPVGDRRAAAVDLAGGTRERCLAAHLGAARRDPVRGADAAGTRAGGLQDVGRAARARPEPIPARPGRSRRRWPEARELRALADAHATGRGAGRPHDPLRARDGRTVAEERGPVAGAPGPGRDARGGIRSEQVVERRRREAPGTQAGSGSRTLCGRPRPRLPHRHVGQGRRRVAFALSARGALRGGRRAPAR